MQSGISRLLETLYFVQGKLESILKPIATPRFSEESKAGEERDNERI
jgi:hypothetical protein